MIKPKKKHRKTRDYFLKFFSLFFTNSDIRGIQFHALTRLIIENSNRNLLEDIEKDTKFEQNNQSNIIWFLWLQGIEEAPELVNICFKKLKQTYPSKQIVFLDRSNLFNYIDLPEFIINKWEKGVIPTTHFSDLIRLSILCNYGGTWIDSTVYSSYSADDEVYFNTPFFFYTAKLRNDKYMFGSSWFITSGPSNPVLLLTKELLINYWKNHDSLVDYFLFHICLQISLGKYPKIYKNIDLISNIPPHLFWDRIMDDYKPSKYKILLSQSPFHKLSNKLNIGFTVTESNYQHFIESNKE